MCDWLHRPCTGRTCWTQYLTIASPASACRTQYADTAVLSTVNQLDKLSPDSPAFDKAIAGTFNNSFAFLQRASCNPCSHRFLVHASDGSIAGMSDWISPSSDFRRKRSLTIQERVLGIILRFKDFLWNLAPYACLRNLVSPYLRERARRRKLIFAHLDHVKNNLYPDYIKHGNHWQLGGLYIQSDHQRQGLGARLLQWGLDRADEDDKAIVCFASQQGTSLYKKHGFQAIEESMILQDEVPSGIFHCTLVRPPKSHRAGKF